ncbi:hypothetical protein L226DRAFT_458664 [Lentinus tigrinus ALCF2SS1-7]|uniref:uncharacterized protein n=1 Tax=Lentinus tigrinus ALCF2SS1-7 TaxID=1328758 RepID=UPI0011660422|nr:hypothetical protein L226DRAFT_458664 [Lentinus tigrinus ALCF2SS1-7]
MAGLEYLPSEVVEEILLLLDPRDVAQFAQTCSDYHALVYDQEDQHLWRELYLQQPFDDPRRTVTSLGRPVSAIDWKTELQRIMRVQTVLTRGPMEFSPEERCNVLRTLIRLVNNVIPATHVDSIDPSPNHAWVTVMVRASPILEVDYSSTDISSEEKQLRARLHTYYGITLDDRRLAQRNASRVFVYAMRNYKWDNEFGPFMMDGSGRVNWVHVRAIHHVMSMHIVPELDPEQEDPEAFTLFPMSMPWTLSIIPNGVNLDEVRDWAGVTGRWQCSFCFCDHRELLIFNNFNNNDEEPLHTAIFDDPEFVEVFRSISVDLRVLSTEEDSDHPGRPRINFGGSIDGTANTATIVGYVKVTPDDEIRWHFTSGENGSSIWSSEGVQVGNVRSKFGVLGSWTTVLHDRHDPVGT